MAVFGALDETRHAQISLYFPHGLLGKDPQYDWAHKAYQTNQWGIIAARAAFDGMMMNPNVVDVAIQLPFTFETGFTNVQFVALAADALEAGDINFANMISSIQTDEARHSQQGGPTLEILVEHDPRRAQWIIDKTFWVSARLFAILTGPAMDYYTPLPMRKQSYQEFMQEWVAGQFADQLRDYGLKSPGTGMNLWPGWTPGTTRCTWASGTGARPCGGTRRAGYRRRSVTGCTRSTRSGRSSSARSGM